MATTTPNYGWTVPTSTDLVKDGATAIETLGDAIDASMNTALGTKKAGMVLLNTTSFSGVSSQSINNVFTSTYTNYAYFINLLGSTNGSLAFRFRAAGVDTSTTYQSDRLLQQSTSVTGISDVTGTDDGYLGEYTTTHCTFSGHIFYPNKNNRTFVQSRCTIFDTNTNLIQFVLSTSQNSTTQFDGLTLLPDAGNITGSISIYGVNE